MHCREKLWLRVGEKRCPHLAHRKVADCPNENISTAIIETRRLLYMFFQERIAAGRLTGPIDLEPTLPGLPDRTRVDLILRRETKPSVAVIIVESRLKPDLRSALRLAIQQQGMIFRAVFLLPRSIKGPAVLASGSAKRTRSDAKLFKT